MFQSITRIALLRKFPYQSVAKIACKSISCHGTRQYRKCSKGYTVKHSINSLFTRRNLLCSFSSTVSNSQFRKSFCTTQEISSIQFEKVSDETLESLTEYFDELVENAAHLPDADVSYGDGVLTVKFGDPHGTYVINRQTPNKQIWLSSPKSGPKRYDFVKEQWIYKHDGKSLHQLLNDEIPVIVRTEVNFRKCSFSGTDKCIASNTLR